MPIDELMKIAGILAFVFLFAAAASGILLFKFHVRWLNLKWHMRFGILSAFFAIVHLALVIYLNI
ncbi:MAG: hypothetical protein COS99_07800 [Candidatus Omnitrophica bacterium CG07_land_8_20_14_0_80_42_15]|uniref:Ferric oxidoreductase domain-containing protein n=1 Tax=Candidatus Aquitaenariimonas noxiae TaxID=1974741 RepID=A0A2J0KX07_9BACT|nr:MAG: hypothetical protein COS99_07800 [Candidatus Omnitrophica bacterium CG07_land_8_20_14_0_80_42_15]